MVVNEDVFVAIAIEIDCAYAETAKPVGARMMTLDSRRVRCVYKHKCKYSSQS